MYTFIEFKINMLTTCIFIEFKINIADQKRFRRVSEVEGNICDGQNQDIIFDGHDD